MSENLIEIVAPHLAAPVTRECVQTASEEDGGTAVAYCVIWSFADDDDE